MSDQDIQKILDFFYTFGHVMVDDLLKKSEKKEN